MDLTLTPHYPRAESNAFGTSSIEASSSKCLMTTSVVSTNDVTAVRKVHCVDYYLLSMFLRYFQKYFETSKVPWLYN